MTSLPWLNDPQKTERKMAGNGWRAYALSHWAKRYDDLMSLHAEARVPAIHEALADGGWLQRLREWSRTKHVPMTCGARCTRHVWTDPAAAAVADLHKRLQHQVWLDEMDLKRQREAAAAAAAAADELEPRPLKKRKRNAA